jgi:hypothetical protein
MEKTLDIYTGKGYSKDDTKNESEDVSHAVTRTNKTAHARDF